MADISVVLVEPKYEGNIGSVARLMKNFGYTDLVLVDPPRNPKKSPDARSMSMHGLDILENARLVKEYSDLEDMFDFLVGTTAVAASDSNARRRPIFPEELAEKLEGEGKVALIFGREDHGLSNEEIDLCDVIVTIPGSSEYPTLNVSHSAAVMLYELTKKMHSTELSTRKKFRKIGGVQKKVLLEKFDDFVDSVQDHKYEREIAKKTFKQIIGRAFISEKEASTITGVFRKSVMWIKKGKKQGSGMAP